MLLPPGQIICVGRPQIDPLRISGRAQRAVAGRGGAGCGWVGRSARMCVVRFPSDDRTRRRSLLRSHLVVDLTPTLAFLNTSYNNPALPAQAHPHHGGGSGHIGSQGAGVGS